MSLISDYLLSKTFNLLNEASRDANMSMYVVGGQW